MCQRSAICTNAYIEAYLKYKYDPSNPTTHLWNRFDVIIWDEAHALCTDSSYQTAPFHVMHLLYQTYKRIKNADLNDQLPENERDPKVLRPRCQHVILMTGTPESIEDIPVIRDSHVLDMRDRCFRVEPKNLHLINTRQAEHLIREQLQKDERIIYFSNHTPSPDILSEKYQCAHERIAVSFSNHEKRKELEKQAKSGESNDLQRMVEVEKYLAEHSCIRPDISLFATTSRNKEGINIKDKDIHHVYIESHSLTDIRQMAGRLRHGAEHVYIIVDSPGYGDNEEYCEAKIAQQFGRPRMVDDSGSALEHSQLNVNLDEFCREQGVYDLVTNPDSPIKIYAGKYQKICAYIDTLKAKFPYFEYDHLANALYYNTYRERSRVFYNQECTAFDTAAESPETLTAFIQKAFPESIIHPYSSPEARGAELVRRFLEQTKLETYTMDELNPLLQDLVKVFGRPSRSSEQSNEISKPNHYLHKAGYHCKRCNNNPKHPNYNRYKIEIWNKKL